MNTLSIEISDSQKAFLEAQACQVGLATPSDYVQALIREAQRRKEWALLEKEIQKGFDSGEPIQMNETYWEAKKAAFLKRHSEAGE